MAARRTVDGPLVFMVSIKSRLPLRDLLSASAAHSEERAGLAPLKARSSAANCCPLGLEGPSRPREVLFIPFAKRYYPNRKRRGTKPFKLGKITQSGTPPTYSHWLPVPRKPFVSAHLQ